MKRALVLFSGGPDSTAAALWGIDNKYEVELLSFLFKLRETNRELRSAMNVAHRLSLKHTIIDLKDYIGFFGDGIRPITHGGIKSPEHNYRRCRLLPFGAGVGLSIASSVAIHRGINTLLWGATKDDGSGRPDYRQSFAHQLMNIIQSVEEGKNFEIIAPHADKHKFQLLTAFNSREDIFSLTWSCTEQNIEQCGACHACFVRRIAARIAKISDQTVYINHKLKFPLTENQLNNPNLIDEDTWHQILESKNTPQF